MQAAFGLNPLLRSMIMKVYQMAKMFYVLHVRWLLCGLRINWEQMQSRKKYYPVSMRYMNFARAIVYMHNITELAQIGKHWILNGNCHIPFQLCERLPSPMWESAIECSQISGMPDVSFTIGNKIFTLTPEEVCNKLEIINNNWQISYMFVQVINISIGSFL